MGRPRSAVVVGGGPAGCSAAINLARAGVEVTLFERGPRDREKPCGDALSALAVAELAKLGLGAARLGGLGGSAFTSIEIREDAVTLTRLDGIQGRVLARAVLDQALRDEVSAQGSTVQHNSTVRGVEHRGRRFSVEVRDRVGSSSRVESDVVILAHGGSGQLSANWWIDGSPAPARAVSWYGPALADDSLTVYYADDLRPGYAWAFPSGAGGANWGVFSFEPASGRRVREAVARLQDQAGIQGKRIRGGICPLWSGSGRRWHDERGIVACGDAGGLADPLTGEGIAAALDSGAKAAESVIVWLDSGDPAALGSYSDWVVDRFTNLYRPTLMRRSFQYLAGLPVTR